MWCSSGMHTSWFYFPHPIFCLFGCIISLEFCKNLFLLLTNSPENLAPLQLREAHRNERGEMHFLCRNYSSFSRANSRAALWGSHHVFLNGFGSSSSLDFLGHAQTCSFPLPPPIHPPTQLLQFCGSTIAGILLLVCIPLFISVYLVTVNAALCQQYLCIVLKSAILFSCVKL